MADCHVTNFTCVRFSLLNATKATFSYDLRGVLYTFVLFCVTYPRTVGIRFHSATRHMLVASIARSKNCRITRKIERGKRYVILFFVFINRNVYNQGTFVALKIFVLFLFIYLHAPRVRVEDISISVYCMVIAYFNLLYFSFYELSSD